MYSLCLWWNITRQDTWVAQVGTPLTCRYLSWSHNISCRISSSVCKPIKWSCLTSIPYSVWWWVFHISIHEGRHNNPKLDIFCSTQIIESCTREYWTEGYLVHSISLGISKLKYRNSPIIAIDINTKTLTLSHSKPNVHECLARKEAYASELH